MLLFLILLHIFQTSSYTIELEKIKNLDPEELETLLTTGESENYEVVGTAYTIHKYKTAETEIRVLQITSFKRDIRLYLEPVHGFLAGRNTPVWKVESDRRSPLGVKYTEFPNAMDDIIQLYQDPYNNAAITSRYDSNGNLCFEGTIGNNLVLRQLPNELREKLSRDKRHVFDENLSRGNHTNGNDQLHYADEHILIEIEEQPSIYRTPEKTGSYTIKNDSLRTLRSKRDINIPVTIYPQILIKVDHDIFSSFETFTEFKQYILSFWNAVDLRYRVFVNPNVRINIAGIIISTEQNGTPCLTNYRVTNLNGRHIIDADQALDYAGKYFYYETTDAKIKRFVLIDNYDVVMIMTKSNLCNSITIDNSTQYDCQTLGYSYLGGACTINLKGSLVEAVGLVEDNARFSGIVPTAHELGHLFGAPHDGLRNRNKTMCPSYEGYIMSGRLTFNSNIFTWSYCSAQYLNDFFRSPRADCLFDPPKVIRKLPRILPGKVLSLDQQCNQVAGSYACKRDSSVCTRLDCFNPRTGTCFPVAPAAEGSPCGNGYYCINGKCIDKRTSEIPLKIAPPPLS